VRIAAVFMTYRMCVFGSECACAARCIACCTLTPASASAVLNPIGRRLTESMQVGPTPAYTHRLFLVLDEFPSLGRLEFFESALAFLAGYGIKAFLIAQSLNQLEKAYGPNHSILDN